MLSILVAHKKLLTLADKASKMVAGIVFSNPIELLWGV